MKRGSFSASREQRAKVKDEPCRNCGGSYCDPAHVALGRWGAARTRSA